MAKSKGKLPGAVVGKFKAKAAGLPRKVKGAISLVLLLIALAVGLWLVFGRDNKVNPDYDIEAAQASVRKSQQRAADSNVTLAETATDPNKKAASYAASASTYIEIGDTQKALAQAKMAYEAGATETAVVNQVTYQYATLMAQNGDYAQAVTLLEKLVKSTYGPEEKAFQATLTGTIEAFKQQKAYTGAQRCEPVPGQEC